MGLLGMQERAQLIGGHVYLQSTGKGTVVQVRVPRDTVLPVERRREGRQAG
jgi:signal transduction histidine kinase